MRIKSRRVATLLPQAFAWAREVNPTQPLTSGVYEVDTSKDESAVDELERIQLRESDVITFHNYSWPEDFKSRGRVVAAVSPSRDLYGVYGALGGKHV